MGSIRESVIENELEKGMFEDLSDSDHYEDSGLIPKPSPIEIQKKTTNGTRNGHHRSLDLPEVAFARVDNGFDEFSNNVRMVSSFEKFKLLSWKNWLIQVRHPLQTFIEILAPVLFSILLVIIRDLVKPELHPDPSVYKPFSIPNPALFGLIESTLFSTFASRLANYTIAWSPANPILEEIVSQIYVKTAIGLRPYNSSDALWQNLTAYEVMNTTTLAGIIFPDEYRTISELPNDIRYSLVFPSESRSTSMHNYSELAPSDWRTRFLFPVYPLSGPRAPLDNDGGYPPGYFLEGFLLLQNFLNYEITSYIYNHVPNLTASSMKQPTIQLERFPYPPYIEDPVLPALSGFVSMIYMLSFVYTCISTVKVITTEKEKQLKEAMKIMGLPCWLHWTAWFVKIFIFMTISVGICTLLVTVKWYAHKDVAVFTHSSPSIIFFTLMMFCLATISFCFMVSVFFSTANMASTVAGPLWFLSYTPFLFMQQRYDTLSLATKLITSLGHNSGMAYAFLLIIRSEGTGIGSHWHNINVPVVNGDNITLLHLYAVLALDSVLYLLIALYVEQIFPGSYGVPQPWYYIFTREYWCGNKKPRFVPHLTLDPNIYEREPQSLRKGVQISNLRKTFGRKEKVAVHGLNLNMYEGQITCLLGHNGAGKTTTMSMLTGMIPPTSGTAFINDFDITKNLKDVRASLGLCPQHNVLFGELTVKEHIYFFARLKGVAKSDVKGEVNKYIELLDLVPKTNTKSSQLSGGMQRKLSVGIALCGGSKVVFLDEPTSGMDPAARRHLWDLLQSEKKNRTMVLTTHFMDEADLLGDRIAILSGGKLQCCGSSFFLKKRYGAGYHLVMEKKIDCVTDDVSKLLQKHLPGVEPYSEIGSELTYILADDQVAKFQKMLEDLEQQSEELHINSYGISLTTLEEVFMKVNGESHENEMVNGSNELGKNDETKFTLSNVQQKTGMNLIWIHFQSMFMKRLLSTLRFKRLFLVQTISPTLMLIIAILVMRNYKMQDNLPELKLDLNTYKDNRVFYKEEFDPTNEFAVHVANTTKEMFRQLNKPLVQVGETNFIDYILDQSKKSLAQFRTKDLFAITIGENGDIISWFNNEGYHTPPIALGLAGNIALKAVAPNYSITVSNKPLPFTLQTKMFKLVKGGSLGFQIAFNMGFSMAIISSFYTLFYIRERVSKCKHLQFVSGVNVFTFWISAFIWDLCTYIVTIAGLIITFACFQEDGYKTPDDLSRIFFIFMMFGIAMLPMMYLASFLFTIPSTGCVRMILLNIITGVAAFITVELLATPGIDLKHISEILEWCFLIIPHFSLSSSIRSSFTTFSRISNCRNTCSNADMTFENCTRQLCERMKFCCDMSENYYAWKAPGIGRQLTFFVTTSIILFTVLLLKEYGVFKSVYYLIRKITSSIPKKLDVDTVTDSDVLAEKQRVEALTSHQIQSTSLVMKQVTKYYGNFLAVNQLSVVVNKNECFGLLGVNGAGKTTTFKMMTGDETISYGDVFVNGLNLKKQLKNVHKVIGYCPQFDALIEELTGRETLHLFCNLRGITGQDAANVSKMLASKLDFMQHFDKQVSKYSGGNKRKLSTALALVSNPSIIYLDEPTTGMDPATKRHLWNVVCLVRDSGRCVVLTSHSMEECEALCTRIAIMVNGQFQCLGSVQHLKNKFSNGIILNIKVKTESKALVGRRESVVNVITYVENLFSDAKLQEEHDELLTFFISDQGLKWSQLFGLMEEAKKTLKFEDYSIAQSSLEQVFLSFARRQRETSE